jgi:stress response protein YsnF
MALPNIDTVLNWRGRTIVDQGGEKIGTFEEIYLDAQTEQPEWAAVKSGLFGRRYRFVPLSEAEEQDKETLRVPFTKEHVDNTPDVDADGELSQEEEARLYEHYGIDYSQEASATGLPRGEAEQQSPSPAGPDQGQRGAGWAGGQAQQGTPATTGWESQQAAGGQPQQGAPATRGGGSQHPGGGQQQRSGAGVVGEDAAVRAGQSGAGRSEEEVESFDVEQKPRERVRLKKYLVTEEVTKTVPVQREEIRVEREPLQGDDG